MRYTKPHFYDTFECLADRCPDTCCAGWQIVIDEDSLDKYEQVEGPFGNRLANSIDWEEGTFLQYERERRCAFLNEQNFCDIYTELAPDALCDTCRMYPRHIEMYDGLREESLSLSCPEAARIMLTCQEPTQILSWETEEEEDSFDEDEMDFLLFTRLEDAREVMFQILRERRLDIRQRMTMVEMLAEKMQQCVDECRDYEIDDVITEAEARLREAC
ncbi:MAG: flagellin lysine-N-methylase, partial [Lachnospiraceae bacterium]|nr:flagellin lysine-N-methylase [Lachnospiraceae bacterium]